MNTNKQIGLATRPDHVGKVIGPTVHCAPPFTRLLLLNLRPLSRRRSLRWQGDGTFYSRLGNPSLTQVEEKLASLEGGEAALGSLPAWAAISSALWSAGVGGR